MSITFDRQKLLAFCRSTPGGAPEDLTGVAAALSQPSCASYQDLFNELSTQDSETIYAAAWALSQVVGTPEKVTLESLAIDEDEPRVVFGDLTVDTDIYNGSALVVLGDLRCDSYTDADPNLALVVLGDARMRWANVYGSARFGGDWLVEELLFAIDHSCSLDVAGTLRAKLLLLEDKTLRASSEVVELRYDSRTDKEAELDALKATLLPALIATEDEREDGEFAVRIEKLLQRVDERKPIYRKKGRR